MHTQIDTPGLCPAVCPEVIPDSVMGTICSSENQTGVHWMKDKCLKPFTIQLERRFGGLVLF